MEPMYYIGLDVHKRKISYCVKDRGGKICGEGTMPATHFGLNRWIKTLPQPWSAAMEATMFTGWIYDHLKPYAAALKVAHPLMLRAIAAAPGARLRYVVRGRAQEKAGPLRSGRQKGQVPQWLKHWRFSVGYGTTEAMPWRNGKMAR